jgi:hypothetical protein
LWYGLTIHVNCSVSYCEAGQRRDSLAGASSTDHLTTLSLRRSLSNVDENFGDYLLDASVIHHDGKILTNNDVELRLINNPCVK